MHSIIEADPHRVPPDSIECQPQGVALYGRRGTLWSGKPRDACTGAGRIDWPTVRDRITLEAVATALIGQPAKRIGSRPAWLCPFHDDHDPSFTVDAKGWRCWACGIGGDAAALVMRHRGIGFGEAVLWLAGSIGIAPPAGPTLPGPPAALGRPGKSAGRPSDGLQGLPLADALSLAEEAEKRLWTPAGSGARRYLEGRGLRPETIEAARLGWTPGVMLPTSDGSRRWRAAGVVIPWRDGDRLCRVKIRQPDGCKPRYAQAFSDRPRVYPGPDAVRPGLPVVITEGEFDALLLGQDLEDLAGVITTGSSSTRLDPSMLPALLRCPAWFAAHDADEAGDESAAEWPSRAVRVRPPAGKDWTESHRAGVDLQRWWIEEHFPAEFDRRERAALMEFDGGLSREDAERGAGIETTGSDHDRR